MYIGWRNPGRYLLGDGRPQPVAERSFGILKKKSIVLPNTLFLLHSG